MIDDSDVFAITIDGENPDHVISSACSGIYESYNSGGTWKKLERHSVRFTSHTRYSSKSGSFRYTIYAATTQGFWMTANGGKSWAM